MKRFTPIILAVAILIGTFAPFTASLTRETGLALTVTHVSAQSSPNIYTPNDSAESHVEDCHVLGEGTVKDCLAAFVYYVPFSLGSWAMGIAAKAFDAAAALTLSSRLYTAGTFLEQGWRITRDFSNIFFILILLFAALSLVLNIEIGHANPKKLLGTVVVIAIVINFSFFITEVIIDLGNSLALVFYNQVVVVNKKDGSQIIDSDTEKQLKDSGSSYITQVRPLSIGLVRSFTPQILSDPAFYNKLAAVSSGSSGFFSQGTNTGTGASSGVKVDSAIMIPLLLMIGLMFCVVAYSFGIALVSLIGRLIGLWVAIIFAPFAFVTYILPSARHFADIGWDDWLKKLLGNAFAAPIYFFYLLLISLLAQTSIIPSNLKPLSPGIILILVMIQFAIIITLLLRATSSIKKASGEIGDMVFKAAGAVLGAAGLAVGTVAGASAVAGRNIFGGLANRALNDTGLQDRAANLNGQFSKASQFLAKQQVKLLSAATKSSFDIRQNSAANLFSKTTGIGLDSFGKFGVKSTAGGLVAQTERLAKQDQEFMELFRTNKHRKEALLNSFDDRETAEDNAQARLGALREAEKRINNAETNLRNANRTDQNGNSMYYRLDANGRQYSVPPDDARQELEDIQANIRQQFGNINIKEETAALAARINTLNKGERDPVTGRQLLYDDMRYTTQRYRMQPNGQMGWDARDGGTLKANGMPVTARDVQNNLDRIADIAAGRSPHTPATLRTESMSMSQLKSLYEEEDKVLARSYLHSVNQKTGFQSHVIYDKLGNIKESHLLSSPRQGARNLARALTESLQSAQVGGVIGAAIGTAMAPALGTTVGAAVGASIGGLSRAIKGMAMHGSQVAADAAHHLEAKGPGHAHAGHEVYHSPSGGIFSALKGIFDSAGSGGGHGGGHGHDDHGGGHH